MAPSLRGEVAGAEPSRLARQCHGADVLRLERRTDDADGDLGVEVLAGEYVDVGVSRAVAKMAGDGRRLDELHERVAGRLRNVLGEMLQHGFAVGLHPNRLNQILDKAANML